MANPTFNIGLKPVNARDGRPWDGPVNRYHILSTYATDVLIGDAVVKTGTSNTAAIETCSGKYAAGSLPNVERVTAGDGNAITGVVVGFDPIPTALGRKYGVASTTRVALVVDDPKARFHIRDDGAAALAATSVGLNAVLIEGTGSTVTGISGLRLDTNSDVPAADASNQLTILRLADIHDNVIGVNAVWEVSINQHTESDGAIGIA